MSWSWTSEQERKEYAFNGTVTISCTEYRDLMEEIFSLRVSGQREHDDWYAEYNKRTQLEKDLKVVTARLNDIKEWLVSDTVAASSYEKWKVEKAAESLYE